MAMRYITIPKPREVINTQAIPGQKIGEKRAYTYFELMREFVWNRPEWRANEVNANVFNRLYDAHEEAELVKLPVISMSEEDFAVFSPFATLQGVQLAGPNVATINRLTQCVTFASSTKPEVLVELEKGQAASANGTS